MNVSGAYSLIIGEESYTKNQSSKPRLYQSGVLYLQLVTLLLGRPISNTIHNGVDMDLHRSKFRQQPNMYSTKTLQYNYKQKSKATFTINWSMTVNNSLNLV